MVVLALIALVPATAAAGGVDPAGHRTHASPALSGAANTWVPTGSMATPRTGQTATLLPDGKVLVAGGGTSAAELYNPRSGTWSQTGSLPVAPSGATATLLPDGDVLVAGGCCSSSNLALTSAELYDPSTGTWQATGSMNVPRMGQTATLLPDGDVLMAGGLRCPSGCGTSTFYNSLRSAELYDPSTGTFTETSSMHSFRELQTATLLRSGLVLVTGGFFGCDDSFCSDDASAELYDPATGTWHRTGSMHVAREQQTATLLPNGEVLVAGGINYHDSMGPGTPYATAEVYDPASGTFSDVASMAEAHVGGAATLLSNGWVLVAGGGTAAADIYQPARDTWVSPGPMLVSRTDLTLTRLHDGTVLAAGGAGPDGSPLASAERFLAGPGPLVQLGTGALGFPTELVGDSSTGQSFTVTNEGSRDLVVDGVGVTGANAEDFDVTSTCAGAPIPPGSSCSVSVVFAPTETALRSAEVSVVDDAPLSPQQVAVSGYGAGPEAWAPTGSMANARSDFVSALLPNGDVLVAGGESTFNALSSAEVWDPQSGTWSPTAPMPDPLLGAAAVTLQDGEVLVVGGYNESVGFFDTAELYDPSTGTWTVSTPMNQAGDDLAATLLPDGDVLVTGFQSGAEVYDPTTATWTDTGPMPAPEFMSDAVLLQDGEVLAVAGGTTAAELYDPTTNAWSATGSLEQARQFATATLLPDGNVLVAGGEPADGGAPLASAELYNASTGTFSEVYSMFEGRAFAHAALLPNGTVMVTGGCTGTCLRPTDTTEFFDGSYYWFMGASMTVPRQDFGFAALPDGSLVAIGGFTNRYGSVTASAEVYTVPTIDITPGSGPVGQSVTVRGYGFDAGESVVLGWGPAPKPQTSTVASSTGTFLTTVTVPTFKRGPAEIQAVGQRSNGRAVAFFDVTGP